MFTRVFCVLALGASSAFSQSLQSEFDVLRELATSVEEMRKTRPTEPAERAAMMKKARELSTAIDSFAAAHLHAELSPEVTRLLIEADAIPPLRSLVDKRVEHCFETGHAAEVLSLCEDLSKAGLSEGSQKRLRGPQAIALFAAGKDDEALKLAKSAAEDAGASGLKMLDIAAAILAARGAFDDAKALFDGFAETHGTEPSRAYQYESKRTMLGAPAPEIGIQHWVGPQGSEHKGFENLAALKGKVVVLDFWQTWCPPCRAVMPGLSKAQERLEKHGVQMLGLCWKDGKAGYDWSKQTAVPAEEIKGENYPAHVAKFSADMGLSYICGIAETRANNDAYGVRGIPTLVIVDASQRVAWITIGSGVGVDALIETLCSRLAQRGSVSR